MNNDEKIAERFLKSQGFSRVHVEPIPNESPDFLCDSTAVEVRRLAQYGPDGQPLKSLDISLYRLLKEIISTIPVDKGCGSYFLTYRFQRPLKLKEHKKGIAAGFKSFGNPEAASIVYSKDGIVIEANPIGGALPAKFRFGITSDQDRGGWLGEIFESANIIAVEYKVEKIKTNQPRYKTWWLVLVDHVGMLKEDTHDRISHIAVGHSFDRIVIIDGLENFDAWDASHLIS